MQPHSFRSSQYVDMHVKAWILHIWVCLIHAIIYWLIMVWCQVNVRRSGSLSLVSVVWPLVQLWDCGLTTWCECGSLIWSHEDACWSGLTIFAVGCALWSDHSFAQYGFTVVFGWSDRFRVCLFVKITHGKGLGLIGPPATRNEEGGGQDIDVKLLVICFWREKTLGDAWAHPKVEKARRKHTHRASQRSVVDLGPGLRLGCLAMSWF